MSEEIKREAEEEVEFTEDLFASMLDGSFRDESVDEDAEDTADEDNDDEEQEEEEDTDQEEESADDDTLDEDSDGDLDEDSEDEEDDEEEDTLVEDDSSDDEDGEDEPTDEESEEDTDTEEPIDGEAPDTDVIDYKAFYESVVNTEFVVNGKKTKGFADPQKIIQSQQMAGGFSEKMAGFKQYRPFMAPLKERGMLDDQSKFDLAMNILDGDKEAIKSHLQSLNIDPLDLDMDVIEYSGKRNVASDESMVIEDTMERAKAAGIEDRVRQVIGNEWDPASFQEFVSNDAVRNDLLQHMESGVYDRVQDKMSEMSRSDYNGTYGSKTTINKYRAAVAELQREAPVASPKAPVEAAVVKAPVVKKPTVQSEKAKIVKAREEDAYKAELTKREAKVSQQRKKAASMSKKKAKAKPAARFDPLAVEGEDLDELMNFLVSSGRG